MESITKNRQTPATLRAMVERAYGAEQVPTGDPETWLEELGHGWFNVAYRILLRDGRSASWKGIVLIVAYGLVALAFLLVGDRSF